MEPFTSVYGQATSLPSANVDTDIIFPARFLVITEKRGLGRYAFHDRRDLTLVEDAPILIAGNNFGCGSSREQAPWALADRGIRVILAPGFGEIFQSNCFKNGILAVVLPADTIGQLHTAARAGEAFTIDLEQREIRLPQTGCFAFMVDPARREALLSGLDEIARIQCHFTSAIADFEDNQRTSAPWLWSTDQGIFL